MFVMHETVSLKLSVTVIPEKTSVRIKVIFYTPRSSLLLEMISIFNSPFAFDFKVTNYGVDGSRL
jgi:hypothetical protein